MRILNCKSSLPLLFVDCLAALNDGVDKVNGGVIRHKADGRELQENDIRLLAWLDTADTVRTVHSCSAVDGKGSDHLLDAHVHVDAAESHNERNVVAEAAARIEVRGECYGAATVNHLSCRRIGLL